MHFQAFYTICLQNIDGMFCVYQINEYQVVYFSLRSPYMIQQEASRPDSSAT